MIFGLRGPSPGLGSVKKRFRTANRPWGSGPELWLAEFEQGSSTRRARWRCPAAWRRSRAAAAGAAHKFHVVDGGAECCSASPWQMHVLLNLPGVSDPLW